MTSLAAPQKQEYWTASDGLIVGAYEAHNMLPQLQGQIQASGRAFKGFRANALVTSSDLRAWLDSRTSAALFRDAVSTPPDTTCFKCWFADTVSELA